MQHGVLHAVKQFPVALLLRMRASTGRAPITTPQQLFTGHHQPCLR